MDVSIVFNHGSKLIHDAQQRPVTLEDTIPLVSSATSKVVVEDYDVLCRKYGGQSLQPTSGAPYGISGTNNNVEIPELHARRVSKILNDSFATDPIYENLQQVPFSKSIYQINTWYLFLCSLIAVVRVCGMYAQVIGLWKIMSFVNAPVAKVESDEDNDRYTTLGWVFLMAFGSWCQSFGQHNILHSSYHTGARARALSSWLCFEKMLHQTPLHKGKTGDHNATGQLLNLVSSDSQSLVEAYVMIVFLFSAPLEAFAALGFSYYFVGWSFAVTMAVLLFMFPLQSKILERVALIRDESFSLADKRMRGIAEFLGGIGVVKYFAWEKNVEELIAGYRNAEGVFLTQSMTWKLFNLCFFFFVPGVMLLVTFGIKTIYKESMDPVDTFVTMSLLQIVARSFQMIPRATTSLGGGLSGFRRIESFLTTNLGKNRPIPEDTSKKENSVVVLRGKFGWGTGFGVRGVDLRAKLGSLTVIMGPVGSGKSTVLHALLENCAAVEGYVLKRPDTAIGYVPQEAWMLDGTVRSNILCDRVLDMERYREVLFACALEPDLLQWGGDLVEVGEKGVTLSGGQKQRIALARACYTQTNLFIFDDPISAVDAVVGRHLMEHCIRGLLRDKTVILVTHHPLPATYADQVFHLDSNGDWSAAAPPVKPPREHGEESDDKSPGDMLPGSPSSAASPVSSPAKLQHVKREDIDRVIGAERTLIRAEESAIGRVSTEVYKAYMQAGGTGVFITFFVLLIIAQALRNAAEWWFTAWSGRKYNLTSKEYVLTEFALVASMLLFSVTRGYLFSKFSMQASTVLHNKMLKSILHSPMHFFESVPLGRIVNRFGKDIDTADDMLARTSFDFLQLIFVALGSIVLMVLSVYWFAIVFFVFSLIFGYLFKLFMPASRYLKRIEATSRSPGIQVFQTTLIGATSVRAMRLQESFRAKFLKSIDTTSQAITTTDTCQRWVGVRLDWIAIVWVLSVGLFVVFMKETVGAPLAGLALSQSLLLTGILQYAVRQGADSENFMTSAERLVEYCNLPEEPNTGTVIPPPAWPTKGHVVVKNLTVFYEANPTEAVLRDVTVEVHPGEKVAIVGRTGAGKSTLLSCFFRMVTIPTNSILIDGQDITQVELHALRSRLGVIPQSPTLFLGSVRYNLDPFNKYTPEEYWEALRKVQLDEVIRSRSEGLECNVGEGGGTLSVGQKQLLCAARVLLGKPQVLFMDEATANVDPETDEAIQAMIRKECKGVSVITIAHRLNTIMDYDKVVVLNRGVVVEVGVPKELAMKDPSDPANVFASMVQAMT